MVKKIFKLFLPLFIIFFISEIAVAAGLYYAWPILDVPMHIIGGFAVAWLSLAIFEVLRKVYKFKISPRNLICWLIIGAVATVGILWELYELVRSAWSTTQHQPGTFDTVKDLVMDLIGAGLFCLYWLRQPEKKKEKEEIICTSRPPRRWKS